MFSQTLAEIIQRMGSRTTSSNELKKLGSRMMPGFFRGVYAAGKQPVRDGSTHFCIVNTMSGPPGQHWLGLYREGHRELLYDSFGRSSLNTEDESFPKDVPLTESDPEQPISRHPDMQYCGQACLAFGIVCQEGGMQAARYI